MSIIGLLLGPCNPTLYMVAKKILIDYNSFVLSLIISGNAISNIIFQKLVGDLLDYLEPRDYFLGFSNFNSSYIISYLLFLSCFSCFLIINISLFIYKKFFHLIRIEKNK